MSTNSSTPKKILSFLSPSPSSLFQTPLSDKNSSPLTIRRKSTFSDMDDFFKNSYIKSRKAFLNPDSSFLSRCIKRKNKNPQNSIQLSKKSLERTSSISENKEEEDLQDAIKKKIKHLKNQQPSSSKEKDRFANELLEESVDEKQKIEVKNILFLILFYFSYLVGNIPSSKTCFFSIKERFFDFGQLHVKNSLL